MFKLLLSFTIVGLVVSTPTSKGLQHVRIVGGEDIDITAAPYQVSLLNRGSHSCGGTIISFDLVVTAAHCLNNRSPSAYSVRVGSSSSREGGQIVPVADLEVHPKYRVMELNNDIGLLWLATPLEFSDKVAPIALYESGEEIEDGDLTTVTGWGYTTEGGSLATTLQKALIPKVSHEECSFSYFHVYNITQSMLCAGESDGGKDACQGDSGGPLVHNGKLAGVVSWGYGCARPNFPGVYAKVSALRSWLDETITKLRLKHILRR